MTAEVEGIRQRNAAQSHRLLLVQQCGEGNPAAAIHIALGLTQKGAAALLGMHQSEWSRYTSGKTSPSATKVHVWLRALQEAGRPLVLRWSHEGMTAA